MRIRTGSLPIKNVAWVALSRFTSPHLILPQTQLTSSRLVSSRFVSPHLTSPHLGSARRAPPGSFPTPSSQLYSRLAESTLHANLYYEKSRITSRDASELGLHVEEGVTDRLLLLYITKKIPDRSIPKPYRESIPITVHNLVSTSSILRNLPYHLPQSMFYVMGETGTEK
ncbi:hypothetical protein M0802_005874 [Mischocyttarus mexicanus]|nr:hypothetical protein M0802_005874 [Mischocyttarus mexicanus]